MKTTIRVIVAIAALCCAVACGYRWNDAKDVAPLFAFGHGLSYTTLAGEFEALIGAAADDIRTSVSFTLK